ncbi:MAG: hypothetical protein ACKOEC_03670 [Acidimicrobiia bacterium]
MSAASHHPSDLPGRLQLPGSLRIGAAAAVAIGTAALMMMFQGGDPSAGWSAYLIGSFFAIGLGVFGIAWLAITSLAGATWAVTMRRVPEAMTAWLLPGGLLMMALLAGAPSLYLWAQHVEGDELLAHKAPFLNLQLFTVLVGASFAAWLLFARAIVGASRRQDRDGGMAATRLTRVSSAIFLVVFALTLSIVSFYFLMSLDVHWFSTMFAVLVFTDVIQTGTAFVAIVTSALILTGQFKGFVRGDHLHALGKMVFSATGFWAYIYFCQFMLIWYANIPEETAYFIRRWENGWMTYLLALPLLKFVVPFMLMIPRAGKRRPQWLIPIGVVLLVAQFLELYVMVAPALGHGEHVPHAHFPGGEFLVTAGFLGAFVLVFSRSLGAHGAVPVKDPAISASLAYHT